MHSTHCVLLEDVLSKYEELKESCQFKEKWTQMNDAELWEEICLCILSSNVPYELAQSSFLHLRDKGFLDVNRIIETPKMLEAIAEELAKGIYHPRKKDGALRKYRFPNTKARDIVDSAHSIQKKNISLEEMLKSNPGEKSLRKTLSNDFKGLGLKQASHFLRNIGFSRKLAIIDTHVISFLNMLNGATGVEPSMVTPTIYLKLETSFLELCELLELDPAVFDYAIWNYMREF